MTRASELADRLERRATQEGISDADAGLMNNSAAMLRELDEALRQFLRCEYEPAGHGLLDCVDNDGQHYQSQHLADVIQRAEQACSLIRAKAEAVK